MRIQTTLLLALALAAGACGDDDTTSPDTGTTPDTGDVDGGTDTGPVPLACDWPSAPYGATPGRKMEPFELTTCDGTAFAYPNEDFCGTRFTIFSIGAGWCGPCILESQQFEAEINERYDPSDVRLVQILIQDEDFNEPDQAFCESWVDRFGLSNVELIDPAQRTNIYFPDNSLPSTIVVNNATGVIEFRENGASEGLTSLRAKIDDLLAGE